MKDSETQALCHQPFCRLQQTPANLVLQTFLYSWSQHKQSFTVQSWGKTYSTPPEQLLQLNGKLALLMLLCLFTHPLHAACGLIAPIFLCSDHSIKPLWCILVGKGLVILPNYTSNCTILPLQLK